MPGKQRFHTAAGADSCAYSRLEGESSVVRPLPYIKVIPIIRIAAFFS